MTDCTLLATLRAPHPRRHAVRVYSDKSLEWQFPPNPKWTPGRITVYRGHGNSRLGQGENITPEQFIERFEGMGYTRVEAAS